MEIIVHGIKYELRPEQGGAYVIENDYSGDFIIPSEVMVDGACVPVVGIAEDAFFSCTHLTSVQLPDGLKTIEEAAFESATALTEIVIPNSVTSIGEGAFSDCTALKKAVLPTCLDILPYELFSSCYVLTEVVMPQQLRVMDGCCFAGCECLTNIVLPHGLQKIGMGSFEACYSLATIQIPDTVKEIGFRAFHSCSSLQQIVLPEGLEYIELCCFAECEKLTDVHIPQSIKMVAPGAFDGTPFANVGIHYANDLLVSCGEVALEDGCLTIQEGMRVICENALYGCKNLRKVIMPSSLQEIGVQAFAECTNLEEVVLNEGLQTIDTSAFRECEQLRSISIPSTVTEINPFAFAGCSALEQIVVSPDNPRYSSPDNCNAIVERGTKILVAGCQNTIIPENVEEICDGAFSRIESLKAIVIPDSVKKIHTFAFSDCVNLQSVRFSRHLTHIGVGAFMSCEQLKDLVLPDTLTVIREDAFDNTAWWENKFAGPVVIGKFMYKYKHDDRDIPASDCIIPEGVEKICPCAFEDAEHIKRIYLPKSLKYLDAGAFQTYDELYEKIVIPAGVGADYPYKDCGCHIVYIDGISYELDHAQKTAKVTRSYEHTYYGQSRIVIPPAITYEGTTYPVTAIGYRAFAFDYAYGFEVCDVRELTDTLDTPKYIDIPSSVQSIEDEAFLYSDLMGITIHADIPHVGENIFKGCDRLQTILVPTELKDHFADDVFNEYYDNVVECVAEIDSVYYNLHVDTKSATVISPFALAQCACYKGHIDIPTVVEYEGHKYAVTDIANFAFATSDIESIVIADGITMIGERAFECCTELLSVDMPNSIYMVGDAVFAECTQLRFLQLSERITRVENDMFYGCTMLQSVGLGSHVEYIGDGAFSECENLRTIYLPNSIKAIGVEVFHHCRSLRELRIPDRVRVLDLDIVRGCDNLQSLILGRNLLTISLPEDIEEIDYWIEIYSDKEEEYCRLGLAPLRDNFYHMDPAKDSDDYDAFLDAFVASTLTRDDTAHHEE